MRFRILVKKVYQKQKLRLRWEWCKQWRKLGKQWSKRKKMPVINMTRIQMCCYSCEESCSLWIRRFWKDDANAIPVSCFMLYFPTIELMTKSHYREIHAIIIVVRYIHTKVITGVIYVVVGSFLWQFNFIFSSRWNMWLFFLSKTGVLPELKLCSSLLLIDLKLPFCVA